MPARPKVPLGLKSILRMELPLIVDIGSREMTIKDLRRLAPGMVIELAKSSEEELEVRVNNKLIGRGRAMNVGGNYGVRITRIGNTGERLSAMSRTRDS